MRLVDAFVAELEREAETTKRVLARVPNEKLNWQPHPKSMSLGQLASHITRIPGGVAKMLAQPQFEGGPVNTPPPVPANASELVPNLEASVADAKTILNNFDDATMMATWKMIRGEKEAFSAPRIGVIRTIMFNHWYHHRGQLSVYLRLLDVPLPSIYGPSADENPFA